MSRLVSYAADGEDVVLHRALRDLDTVTYADVGAGHPGVGSVTTALYALGWRGVHVEPVASYAAELRAGRPEDVVIEAAAGSTTGAVPFWFVPDSGLSTTSEARAQEAAAHGWAVHESSVGCRRLSDVLDEHLGDRDLHVLRVDVGGDEADVLGAAGLERHRPWVVLVRTSEPVGPWQEMLASAGYVPALFDGANRWYAAPDHPELLPALSHPACSLDPWVRVGVSFPDPPSGEPADVLSATALQLAVARVAQTAAEAQTAELKTQIRLLETDVARRDRVVAHLEETVSRLRTEHQRAVARSDAMQRSASWRLTLPLRVLGRLAGRLLPRRTRS